VDFRSKTFGKWILAGEHAVLRGHPALVFPVFSRTMVFEYGAGDDILQCEFSGESSKILEPFFGALISKALETAGKSPADLRGKIKITNQIPVGAGMGASAALCVNIAKWFVDQSWIKEKQVFEFAKVLESVPHGESSGVDIATVMAKQGIRFLRTGEWRAVHLNWTPNWYLLHSGKQGITAKCVAQVNQLHQANPALGREIDNEMARGVSLAEQALKAPADQGFALLKNSIDSANRCFEQWQLIDETMKEKAAWLKSHGAVATKPVGSGGGGFLLGLWPAHQDPPSQIIDSLISCNSEEPIQPV
jgi:mevalonate kinase